MAKLTQGNNDQHDRMANLKGTHLPLVTKGLHHIVANLDNVKSKPQYLSF